MVNKDYTAVLGGYKLTEFPGSEQDIIISHSAYIKEEFRGKGFGTELHRQRIQEARNQNLTLMLCVVNDENEPQKSILRKFNWKKIDSFVSECTCHRLNLYSRSPYDETGMK